MENSLVRMKAPVKAAIYYTCSCVEERAYGITDNVLREIINAKKFSDMKQRMIIVLFFVGSFLFGTSLLYAQMGGEKVANDK